MSAQEPRQLPPVVVAVSGDGADAGIRYGAAEAVRDGGTLHVVHVLDQGLGWELRRRGHEPLTTAGADRVCREAVEQARRIAGRHVTVTSEVFHGELVEGLVEVSRDARLLVLQRHAVGAPRRDPRATSAKVAARANVPVVCVPRDWVWQGHGVVTVGVDDPERCAPLLRASLQAAWSRQAHLRILHAEVSACSEDAERELAAALAEAQAGLRPVKTHLEVVAGSTLEAVLTEAMATSELLVVGRHAPRVPGGSRVGGVARRVVRDATCPVLLVSPALSTSATPGPGDPSPSPDTRPAPPSQAHAGAPEDRSEERSP